jgi:hypothetical protein
VKRVGSGKNVKYEGKYNRGVAAYTQTDDQKAEIKEIITRVQNLVSVVETPEMTYETFVEELGARMKELEQITGPLPVEANPAKEGPAATAPAEAAAAAIPDGPGEAAPAKPATGKAPPAATPPAAASPVPSAAPEATPPVGTKSP